jgi:haloalkane dehalogenase
MPDLIGLGYSSDPGRDAHTLENHAQWLGAAIEQLGLQELVFVGQDWGGPIGLRMLAERPGLARALVILNTAVGPPSLPIRLGRFHRLSRRRFVSNLLFDVIGFPLRTLHLVQGDRSSIRGKVAKAYRHAVRRNGHIGTPLSLARMVPDREDHPSIPPLRECQKFVTSFPGPVEVVWGNRDPVLGKALKRVRELLPAARITETQGGHFLQEEVPREIAEATLRCYRAIAASSPAT